MCIRDRCSNEALLLLSEDSVGSLLSERLVTGSGVVANKVVDGVSHLVLSQLQSRLLGVGLDSGGDFVGDIFAAGVRHN